MTKLIRKKQFDELFEKLKEISEYRLTEVGYENTFDIFGVKKNLNVAMQSRSIFLYSNNAMGIDYQESENIQESEKKYIFFIFCYAEKGLENSQKKEVLKEIESEILKNYDENKFPWQEQFVEIKVCFIAKSIESSMNTERYLNEDNSDFRKCIQNLIQNLKKESKIQDINKKKFPLRNISITYEFLGEEFVDKLNEIKVLSRTFATPSNLLEEPYTRGIIFSARLFDVVNMYSLKGRSLFSKNIRQGIKEVLGVDDAIYKTLKEKPEDFWFNNNGITILVEKKKLDLKNHWKITLSDAEKGIKLNVINGAQTLNSAAKFFYRENDEVINNAKDKAYVMLRVVEMDSTIMVGNQVEVNERLEDRINQMTISLNRQKPVMHIDIIFTLPVIQYINSLNTNKKHEESELGKFSFSIVRRGEASSIKNKSYSLTLLPRVLSTIFLEEPGTARSAGIDTIMKIDKKTNKFIKKNLFPFLENEDDNIEEEFKKLFLEKYRPVNFAMGIVDRIDELTQKISSDFLVESQEPNSKETKLKLTSNAKKIVSYGKYLLLYSIVYALRSEEDISKGKDNNNCIIFENWNYTMEDAERLLTEEAFIKIINQLELAWNENVDNNDKWELNMFKLNENKKVAQSCLTKIKEILLVDEL